MGRLGRKNCLIFGTLILSLSSLSFGYAGYSATKKTFFMTSAIARLFQGVGVAIISVSISSIISIEFPEKQDVYIGYFNIAYGFGVCLGPVIGSIVSSYLDYTHTFYVFTCIVSIIGLMTSVMIPNRINNRIEQ
jgi:MFS family permease